MDIEQKHPRARAIHSRLAQQGAHPCGGTHASKLNQSDGASGHPSRLADLLELTKARLVGLVLVTVGIGYSLAGGSSGAEMVLIVTGVGLVAYSASILNQWRERFSDKRMERTCQRPLPAGRIQPNHALTLAGALALGGGLVLWATHGGLLASAALLIGGVYVWVYTPLKRRTPMALVVGAVVGAAPPVLGTVAGAGHVEATGATLAAVLFAWQFPHFAAIDWCYREDYAHAGHCTVAVCDPSGRTSVLVAIGGSAVLLPVSLVPAVTGMATFAHSIVALLGGVVMLVASAAFARRLDETGARTLFRCSLLYLPVLLFAWLAALPERAF